MCHSQMELVCQPCSQYPLWSCPMGKQLLYPKKEWPSCPLVPVAWLPRVICVLSNQVASFPWLNEMSSTSKADGSVLHRRLQDNSAPKSPYKEYCTRTWLQYLKHQRDHSLLLLNHCLFYALSGRADKGTKVRSILFLSESKLQASHWVSRCRQWMFPFGPAHECFLLLTTVRFSGDCVKYVLLSFILLSFIMRLLSPLFPFFRFFFSNQHLACLHSELGVSTLTWGLWQSPGGSGIDGQQDILWIPIWTLHNKRPSG